MAFPYGLPIAIPWPMLKDFEDYQVAKEFYWVCREIKLPRFLQDQLLRASSSIALNIAEGSGKRTPADQSRFYSIAFGSLRECQAILDLERIDNPNANTQADRLGAMLSKLSKPTAYIHGKLDGNAKRQTSNGCGKTS